MGLALSKESTPEARLKLDEILQHNSVVVFHTIHCPYSQVTKISLRKLGASFTAVDFDREFDLGALRAAVRDRSGGQTSTPNIFIMGQSIGGNSELQKMKKTGQLQDILRQAGAMM